MGQASLAWASVSCSIFEGQTLRSCSLRSWHSQRQGMGLLQDAPQECSGACANSSTRDTCTKQYQEYQL